jgi:hypothetical protein
MLELHTPLVADKYIPQGQLPSKAYVVFFQGVDDTAEIKATFLSETAANEYFEHHIDDYASGSLHIQECDLNPPQSWEYEIRGEGFHWKITFDPNRRPQYQIVGSKFSVGDIVGDVDNTVRYTIKGFELRGQGYEEVKELYYLLKPFGLESKPSVAIRWREAEKELSKIP